MLDSKLQGPLAALDSRLQEHLAALDSRLQGPLDALDSRRQGPLVALLYDGDEAKRHIHIYNYTASYIYKTPKACI